MEYFFRVMSMLLSLLATLINKLMNVLLPRKRPEFAPITNPILTKSVTDLVTQLRRGQLRSVDLVTAYIARVREVNTLLNAVAEDRFEAALQDAQRADDFIAKATTELDRLALYTRYPLLGIPFTVKESCALKGLSYAVGSMARKNLKAPRDGDVVELMRSAGGIPLLVSANPEFCMTFETKTVLHGRCRNPYDLHRTTAGSSGGEGALNGSGATPFGVASDVAGSIRLPALFCGVFGHKPTGGLTSVKGHFPYSTEDKNFDKYLQIGPITRFARDMPLLLEIMAGDNKDKLKLNEQVALEDIQIYYAYGYSGFNALSHPIVDFEIKLRITQAVKCFQNVGMQPKKLSLDFLRHSTEMVMVAMLDLKGIPSIITQQSHRSPSMRLLIIEFLNSLIGHSLFTKEALVVEIMKRLNGLMCVKHMDRYRQEIEAVRTHLIQLLGSNGVLFLPTFHTSAMCFNTSLLNFSGIDIMTIFNVLGFPSTHVTMGLNLRGMPVGFQVVAAPYQDKLCLKIAAELEGAFHGWVPSVPHQLITTATTA